MSDLIRRGDAIRILRDAVVRYEWSVVQEMALRYAQDIIAAIPAVDSEQSGISSEFTLPAVDPAAIRAAALREAADYIEHAPAGTRMRDRDALLALIDKKPRQ